MPWFDEKIPYVCGVGGHSEHPVHGSPAPVFILKSNFHFELSFLESGFHFQFDPPQVSFLFSFYRDFVTIFSTQKKVVDGRTKFMI